ncbi:nitroreductase/quinone reductase family protein [Actinopolymorpha pittospori]|uniref:Deazaflavin-dependent oxidoreductase (Nitroreductase family) n=1 Tax=Actinopolymorpha pittospori TaxID=648752 RepID=A0A927MPW0_9ACTN|nr:nitroreductase/quinone reductase family protein [Actinopolymorpha pittospori]MBE1604686.1 deazaflavin-dependent oxidoreductase (nitroreductase family) [Actinopolymorpha pittospori]
MWEHNKDVIAEFRGNGGRVGGRFATVDLALITTAGARSGRSRTAPVVYFRDGDGIFVIASAGGAPRHPDWYRNLAAHPDLTVELGTESFAARAEEVPAGPEYERLFALAVEVQPGFAEYRAKAGRHIPS